MAEPKFNVIAYNYFQMADVRTNFIIILCLSTTQSIVEIYEAHIGAGAWPILAGLVDNRCIVAPTHTLTQTQTHMHAHAHTHARAHTHTRTHIHTQISIHTHTVHVQIFDGRNFHCFVGNLSSIKIKSSKFLKQSQCIWSSRVDNK